MNEFVSIGYLSEKKISENIITGEVSRGSSRNSVSVSRDESRTKLSLYDKNRVKKDKTKNSYTLVELKKIAALLNIPSSLRKEDLVDEIHRQWEACYDEGKQ